MTSLYRLLLEHWHGFFLATQNPLSPFYASSVIKLANIKEPYYVRRK